MSRTDCPCEAILPGELFHREGEARVQYPTFRSELVFFKYQPPSLSRLVAMDEVEVETVRLKVTEILSSHLDNDGIAVVTCARYAYA